MIRLGVRIAGPPRQPRPAGPASPYPARDHQRHPYTSPAPHILQNQTPLHLASAGSNVEAVQVLIAAGANVNTEDVSGRRGRGEEKGVALWLVLVRV